MSKSLSAYARQFLELMQKPDVDSIDGLSPAISIEQKTTSKNPRSTVGTVTEIYDYLRLLYARVGIPYSPATGLPIESQTVSQMVDRMMEMAEGTRLYLLAPVVRGRKGEYRKELADLQKRGFQRVKVDGQYFEIDSVPTLNKKLKHDIEVVVDRLVVRAGIEKRLADSLETALGLVRRAGVRGARGWSEGKKKGEPERVTFSAKFACPVSGFTIDEIEPRLFSFNNPYGACPTCDGLGTTMFFDPELVVPDEKLSLREGAVAPWANSTSQYYMQTLDSLARHYKFSVNTPWQELPEKARNVILQGSGSDAVTMEYDDGLRSYKTTKPFEGVIPNMDRRWRETDSAWVREELSRFQATSPCEACKGHAAEARGARRQDRPPDHLRGLRLLDRPGSAVVPGARQEAEAQAAGDRPAHPEGDQRAPRLPRQRRPRLPHAVAGLGDLVGRREPAHPAGLADRLGPHRRALCAGRAVDRAASARQPAVAGDAEAAARSRQHRPGGRA